MSENVAKLIRENELLREVCAMAIRLRRIGQKADEYEEAKAALYAESPHISRSATGAIMYAQAYETALSAFDAAVMKAAAAGFDWERDNTSLGPALAASHPRVK